MDRVTLRNQAIILLTSWVGLVLGVLIVMSSTFSVLFAPITAEFGWDRSQLALAYSLFSLTSTLAMPAIGKLVDQIGTRKVVIGCVMIFAAITFLLRFVTSLWQFCALFFVLGIVAGGTSTLPYFKVLVRTFKDRRGLALGLANSGTASGTFIFPFIAYQLNESFGWRNTYLAMGLGVAILTTLVVHFGFRRHDAEASDPSTPAETEGMMLSEAIRTPQFWIIGISFFIATTALVGYLIHVSPLLSDRGMPARSAALAASIFGGAQLFGRLAAGYLLDKLPSAFVAAGLWVLATLSFGVLWTGVTGYPLYICTAIAGLAFGGEGDVLAYFVSKLFGAKSFGRIYSVLLMINLLGGVVGPYLFGLAFDTSGSYTSVLGASAIAALAAAVLISSLRKYSTTAVVNRYARN